MRLLHYHIQNSNKNHRLKRTGKLSNMIGPEHTSTLEGMLHAKSYVTICIYTYILFLVHIKS